MKTRLIPRHLRRFLKASEAVSALEYAILVGVVTIAVGAGIVTFSGNITTAINEIGTNLDGATNNVGAGEIIASPPAPGP